MNQIIGFDSRYIASNDNNCADTMSHISKNSLVYISKLLQAYSKLATHRRYHPVPELVSLIYKALMNDL